MIYGSICNKLGEKLESLQNLEGIFVKPSGRRRCRYCNEDLVKWQTDIKERIKSIAAFSTFT
jgi:hypothetical protein